MQVGRVKRTRSPHAVGAPTHHRARKKQTMKVEELMAREVRTCQIGDSLQAAAQIMWENDCGCVPVLDHDGWVVAMLTDRDICMAAYLQGKALTMLPVSSAMSRTLWACGPGDTLAVAEKLLRANQIHRLPVIDGDGCLVGILSLGDIARAASGGSARRGKAAVSATEVASTLGAICQRRAAPIEASPRA